jgi:uncharacterized membrane protein YgcG
VQLTQPDDLRTHQFRANVGTGVLGVGFAIVVLAGAYLVASGIGLSLPDRGYTIDRHHVAASIDGADLHVTEYIDVIFHEGRRGIIRDLPTAAPHRGPALGYTDIRVTSESQPDVPHATQRFTDLVEVRIGDPDRVVTGTVDYVLDYTITGLTADLDGAATVRWDALLYDWDTTVTDAAVTLTAPPVDGVTFSCVVGRVGGTTACPEPTIDGASATWMFDRLLRQREGATVQAVLADVSVDGLPTAALEPLDTTPVRFDPVLTILALVPIGAAVVGARPLTRRRVRDLVDGAPVTFSAPPGMDPAGAARILHRRPDPTNGYLATILHLAAGGHIALANDQLGVLCASSGDADEWPSRQRDLVRRLTGSRNGHRGRKPLEESAADASTFAAFQRASGYDVRARRLTIRNVLRVVLVTAGAVVVLGPFLDRFLTPVGDLSRIVVDVSVGVVAVSLALVLYRWQHRATAPHLTSAPPETVRRLVGYRSFLNGHAGSLEFAAEDAGIALDSAYLQHLPYAVAFGDAQAWIERYGPLVTDAPEWVPTTHAEYEPLRRSSHRGHRARQRADATRRAAASRGGDGSSGRFSVGAGGSGGGSGGGGGSGRSW